MEVYLNIGNHLYHHHPGDESEPHPNHSQTTAEKCGEVVLAAIYLGANNICQAKK